MNVPNYLLFAKGKGHESSLTKLNECIINHKNEQAIEWHITVKNNTLMRLSSALVFKVNSESSNIITRNATTPQISTIQWTATMAQSATMSQSAQQCRRMQRCNNMSRRDGRWHGAHIAPPCAVYGCITPIYLES